MKLFRLIRARIACNRLLDAIKASPALPWSAKGAPICELLDLISMLSAAENRRRAGVA